MKFECSAQELLGGLINATRALSSRPAMQILEGVLLKTEEDAVEMLSLIHILRSIGLRGDGGAYRTAIQNPDLASQQQALLVLELRDQSLVTSGSYQRFYTVDGKPYHHIIDPDTLMPADYLLSVSVVTEDGGLADALSTALFTLPVQKGQALLQTLAGVEAVWVLPDGSVVKSGGL